jgi:glycosyltransferase involved in cell wall biosynthesis
MLKNCPNRKVLLLSSFKGWILEGMVRESAEASGINIRVLFIPQRLQDVFRIKDFSKYILGKKIEGYCLFVNQSSYFKALLSTTIRFIPENSRVLYTHRSIEEIEDFEQIKMLQRVNKIFVLNSKIKADLISSGISDDKIITVFGAIDRKVYHPVNYFNKSGSLAVDPYVLISGDCKPRKNPNMIIEVIRRMRDVKFVIHGRGWQEYLTNQKIDELENLKVIQFEITNNPQLVREASAYLSLSELEGGPFPTLESLASGTPVVVTDTGWNKEIVKSGFGTVLSLTFTINEVITAINEAIKLKPQVCSLDLLKGEFTWKSLGQKLYAVD